MAECGFDREMLSAFFDGGLSDKESGAVREHLAVCEDCAAVLADYAVLSAELGALEAEPPETLRAGVMYRIKNESKTPKRFIFGTFSALAACIALVLIGTSSGLLRLPFGGSSGSDSAAGESMEANSYYVAQEASDGAAPAMWKAVDDEETAGGAAVPAAEAPAEAPAPAPAAGGAAPGGATADRAVESREAKLADMDGGVVTEAEEAADTESAVEAETDEALLEAAATAAPAEMGAAYTVAGAPRAEDFADRAAEPAPSGRKLMLNGILYYDSGKLSPARAVGPADGKISSSVDESEIPEEDGQSNFGTGWEYRWPDDTGDTVEVNIEGSWAIFVRTEDSAF